MQLRNILIFLTLLLSTSLSAQDYSSSKIKKIVIDAGHGGHDSGAVSPDKRHKEKNITLQVALELGNLIKQSNPDIQVIYTRDNDFFVPLYERTAIANRNKADLFISIHVNSVYSKEPSGTETFVLGQDMTDSNLEVTKLENSVIVLEEDYTSKYEGFNPNEPDSYIIFSLLQNSHLNQSLDLATYVQQELKTGPIIKSRGIKQAGFVVLWRATMPSILVELGFISNTLDRAHLTSDESKSMFAKKIANAFNIYRARYEGTNFKPSQNNLTIKQEEIIEQSTNKESYNRKPYTKTYKIQILTSEKELNYKSSELKKITNLSHLKVGNLYKFFVGEFDTFDKALKELPNIRSKFKGAFIVEIDSTGSVKPAKK